MKVSVFLAIALVASSASAQVRIIQTNSMGDNIHLIDPKTNQIVGEVTGVPLNASRCLPRNSRTALAEAVAEFLTA